MLEVTLTQASLLKKVIESMKDLVNEANVDCSSTGLSLQALDPKHEAMVTLLLRSNGFGHYRCDSNLTMGLNLHTVAKVLTCADSYDTVTLKSDDASDCVTFKFDSIDTDFEMKLMDIDRDDLQITEKEYDAIVQMPSSEFARICNDLSTFGDTVVLSVTEEGLKFSAKGDTDTTSIVRSQNNLISKPEDATIIEMKTPVSLKFSLILLNSFTKATPLASRVTLRLCSDWPILVEYKIEEMGYLKFYLAPKMKGYDTKPNSNRKTKRLRKNDFSYFMKQDMEDRKRHRAKIEMLKEEKLRLKKEEQENKIILLKEEVRMMQQKQMDTDMQFFLTQHDNLTGMALKAVLARKREIAQRWGWE